MTQTPEGLDDLYQDIILDHFRSPRHQGALAHADLHGEGFNPFCGDQVDLTMALGDDGRVTDVGFEGQGCLLDRILVVVRRYFDVASSFAVDLNDKSHRILDKLQLRRVIVSRESRR